MKRYNNYVLNKLETTYSKIVEGTEIIIKDSGIRKGEGYPDPFELYCLDMAKVYEDLGEYNEKELYPELSVSPLEAIRRMLGFPAQCLSTHQIVTEFENISYKGIDTGIWSYKKAKSVHTLKPCLIYIHGGVWVGGSVFTDEYQCKYIAQLADAVVFNIDYPLAPEVKFPINLECCYEAVKHIYENAKRYGIDKNRIIICGDSAGGNIAAALTLMSRDNGNNFFKMQYLIYPGLCMCSASHLMEGYCWDISKYEIADEYRSIIESRIDIGTGRCPLDIVAEDCYLNDIKDGFNKYASPILAESFDGLPDTVVVSAEFDGLRIQEEFYTKMLRQAGINVRMIRYAGTFHGFFDRLGFVPQAEDVCIDIAKILKKI